MAINVKTVICPACGAKVNYDDNKKTNVCEFCGAVLDMTEQYGDKKDRERDDLQDRQIRDIMYNMNSRRVANVDANMQQAKKVAKIIAIFFIVLFIGSIASGIIMGISRYKDAITQQNKETVNEIDPFDKVNINYYGVSGKATARLNDSNKYEVSSIEKTISKDEGLKNGDTITVKYTKDSAKQYNTKYVLLKTEKTYTVEGLDEYVDDVMGIEPDDLEVLKKNAIIKAEAECKEDEFAYLEGSFDIYAVYTMVKKDFNGQRAVFIVTFDYKEDGEIKTGYFMAEYNNMIKCATGDYKINFNADVFSYTRESYYGGFTVPSAHSTWDSTYTDVYLNNKGEWSVKEHLFEKEKEVTEDSEEE